MEHIALIMKRGKLSQKDINAFHREMERAIPASLHLLPNSMEVY